MPNLTSGSGDGHVLKALTSNWAAVRDGTTGTANNTNNYNQYSVRVSKLASGRGTQWQVWRTFFAFNTSAIKFRPSVAELNVYGRTSGTADLFVVKSEQSTTLANTDFDAITGWSAGADNSGNVTKYSSEVTSWSTSGYNTIPLNSVALSDMVSLDTFKVCLIEADYDLTNTEPDTGVNIYSGVYYADSGTSTTPYIDLVKGAGVFFGCNF